MSGKHIEFSWDGTKLQPCSQHGPSLGLHNTTTRSFTGAAQHNNAVLHWGCPTQQHGPSLGLHNTTTRSFTGAAQHNNPYKLAHGITKPALHRLWNSAGSWENCIGEHCPGSEISMRNCPGDFGRIVQEMFGVQCHGDFLGARKNVCGACLLDYLGRGGGAQMHRPQELTERKCWHTDIHTDRQVLTGYTISSASWADYCHLST